jgi:hypothetical protein
MSEPENTVKLEELFRELEFVLCAGSPPTTRERYVAAVKLIADFLSAAGLPLPIYVEILELANAMTELDRGIVRNFLKPETTKNRPPDPSDIWQSRTQIAVAVEQMVLGRLSKRESCRRIAKGFPQLKSLLTPKSKNLPMAIDDWFKRLSDGEVGDPIATDIWSDRAKLVEGVRGDLVRAGITTPDPLQVAFALVRSKLLALGGLANRRSERESDAGQNMLREARIEREFTRPPRTLARG